MYKCPAVERGAISGIAQLGIGLTSIFPVSLVMYWGYLINIAGGGALPLQGVIGAKHK